MLLLGDAEDLADDDQVIAAVVVDGVEALEPGQRSVKERRIAKTGLERDAGEIAAPGEMLGQWPLIRGKDMDREVARCLEGRKAGRLARRRPQDEGRIERHGREAVDRHPERPTRGHRGDDRHPGRETAERTTQVVLREFLHAASPAASETDVVGRRGANVDGPETCPRHPSPDLVNGASWGARTDRTGNRTWEDMMRRLLLTGAVLAMAMPAWGDDVGYEIGGERFTGYFAAAAEPRGLVLIIHDWDGLDDYERQRADMIAELGYDAFAADLFGADNRPETTEARQAATRAVLGDRERLLELVLAALEEGRALSDADQVVIAGYCFGGTVMLAAARSGEVENAAGYASFHGHFPQGEAWPQDTAPILIMHGGIDQGPSIEDLASFVREAEEAGLTYTAEIYSGADHAFTVFGGDNYQERADTLSWERFRRFLAETLG